MSEITLNFVHSSTMGYGRLGVKLARALQAAGLTVYDDMGEAPTERLKDRAIHQVTPDFNYTTAPEPTPVACWVSTPGHANWWYRGQHAAMFTMWEASSLPETFRQTLHAFDTVIVPSRHNVELFSEFHDNVRYVPLATDWTYQARRMPSQYFNFLIGGSGPRKGTDLAYQAFQTVFPKPDRMSPEPRLVMKNPKRESYYEPWIDMVAGHISDEAEVELYANAHCYLQPSRGEGFGFQPLQAIMQGCPTILTNAHGHEAFAELGIGLDATMTKAAYFIFGDAGEWWEPDFEQLCEAMWDVYQNYPRHVLRARQNAARAARIFTWENTAANFCSQLPIDGPYHWTGGYVVPDVKLYHVRVRKPERLDVAGVLRIFQPGVDYREVADLKRILFDADMLDPACLEETDHGLTPEQGERIGQYSAENSYCPTCGQQLNTRPTKADAYYEGALA